MGLENREYYRGDNGSGSSWRPSSSGTRSMVVTIIIINVAIFIVDSFAGPIQIERPGGTEAESQISSLNAIMQFLAMESPIYEKPWKFWTLLTHGFAHTSINSDIWHVAGNMLVLFFLGRPIEQRLGPWEFLKFYLIAILVSGLAFLILRMGAPATVVGASGAVSAVVALFIFCYPKQTVLLMGVIPMTAWLLGVAVVLMDVSRAFDPNNHVAWQAHLGGFAFGALYFFMQWNFSWLQLENAGKAFKSRPALKIHRPTAEEKLKEQADAILEKINNSGEESLTARERKLLKKYSEQVRKKRS